MAFFDKFPYTNFQELNLDWMLSKIGSIDTTKKEIETMKEQAADSAKAAAGSANAAEGSQTAASESAAAAQNSADSILAERQQIDKNTSNISTNTASINANTTSIKANTTSINANTASIKANTARINENRALIEKISNRKFIIISDSYGVQTNNWIDNLVKMINLSSSDYFTSSVGGSGFANGTTFIDQLTTLAGTITDKDSITDIIVGGGFNDRSIASANVRNAISRFVGYAKTNFKNAAVHIGFISWSFNSEFISELVSNNVLNTYKQCCEYGANYITSSDLVMHDSALFKQENQSPYTLFLGYQYVHPNDAGSVAIANCIANYIKCGSGVSYDSYALVTPKLYTGVTIGVGDLDLLMRKSGNNISIGRNNFALVSLNFSNAVNLDGNPIELGMLESGLVAGVSTTGNIRALTYLPVTGFAVISGANVDFNGLLLIANNRIYLLSHLENATAVSTIALYGAAGNFNTNEA